MSKSQLAAEIKSLISRIKTLTSDDGSVTDSLYSVISFARLHSHLSPKDTLRSIIGRLQFFYRCLKKDKAKGYSYRNISFYEKKYAAKKNAQLLAPLEPVVKEESFEYGSPLTGFWQESDLTWERLTYLMKRKTRLHDAGMIPDRYFYPEMKILRRKKAELRKKWFNESLRYRY